MDDFQSVEITESIVLSKFEGEPLPENEVERVHIVDGVIVSVDKIENCEVVSTKIIKEVE